MGKVAALLGVILVVSLVACGGESETVEQTTPADVADAEGSAIGTPPLPTFTSESPTDTTMPPTPNAMQAAMTQQAQGDVVTPRPSWTPWPTPSTQIEVTWDGTECVVTGTSVVPVGYNEFIWRDLTEHGYGLAVRYLHDGYSYQDLLNLQDEPGEFIPSRPSWVEEIEGRYRRDDSLDAEVYTYHFDQEGNYDIHFWDSTFLWVCGGLTAVGEGTPNEVEPLSCQTVEGVCLELTFDGENCVYKGPSEIEAGPITFIYLNESEKSAYVNMLQHTGDKTIQDAIDYIGEEPSTKHHPDWTLEIPGFFRSVSAGNSYTWEGELEPGIHHMICANVTPLGVYFGGGFTVED